MKRITAAMLPQSSQARGGQVKSVFARLGHVIYWATNAIAVLLAAELAVRFLSLPALVSNPVSDPSWDQALVPLVAVILLFGEYPARAIIPLVIGGGVWLLGRGVKYVLAGK